MNAGLRNELVRGERQVELDIGKGIAVLLMICVHVQEALSHSVVQYSLFGCIVEFVTGFPAAPLFMFVMGVGTVYSRRQDAGYAIGRGASLLHPYRGSQGSQGSVGRLPRSRARTWRPQLTSVRDQYRPSLC